MKISTLRILRAKYPEYTDQQIKLVVNTHLKVINQRISNNTTLNILVPSLGRIHTHGNAKNKSYVARLVRYKKWHHNKKDFSDKTLLF